LPAQNFDTHKLANGMIRLLFLFGLLISNLIAIAKNTTDGGGTIQGKVTTSDGLPAANVSVIIKETGKGVVTNESGEFRFKNVQNGTYQLEVSLVGYETI
jgi:iron complex outermembrane receptor protein